MAALHREELLVALPRPRRHLGGEGVVGENPQHGGSQAGNIADVGQKARLPVDDGVGDGPGARSPPPGRRHSSPR